MSLISNDNEFRNQDSAILISHNVSHKRYISTLLELVLSSLIMSLTGDSSWQSG